MLAIVSFFGSKFSCLVGCLLLSHMQSGWEVAGLIEVKLEYLDSVDPLRSSSFLQTVSIYSRQSSRLGLIITLTSKSKQRQ